MSRLETDLPKDLRITDPYVRELVEAERARAGESTATKTAARLILERLAQREYLESLQRESPSSSLTPTDANAA